MLSKSAVHCVENFDRGRVRDGRRERPSIAAFARGLYSNQPARWAAGIVLFAVSAAAFYRLRELLAALLLFSVLFALVMIGALFVWLIDEAAHRAAVHVESHLGHIPPRQVVAPSRAHAKQAPEGRT